MSGLSGTTTAFMGLLGLAEPSAVTPPLPVAPAPTEARQGRAREPEILYVNFDGAVLQGGCGNDPQWDCSTLANLFDGYVGPFDGNLNQRMAILQATRKAVADFGIRVLVDRPPEDVDYTMVIYGDLGSQSFAGIAPYIDCEDLNRGDTSFTDAFGGSNTGSTVILQEAAHTWGLEHVDSEFDILNPFKVAGRTQVFMDECYRIVANTDLQPTAGSCNQVHTRYCDSGHQNSYREMLDLFGPAIPDVNPPELEITYPPDGGTFVLPTTFSLQGTIVDELHPQFYQIEISQGDEVIFNEQDVALNLLLSDPPAGEYDLTIRLTDEGGNTTQESVSFTILPEGSELPDAPTESTDEASGCRVGGHGELGFGVLLGLGTLVRRRTRGR